MDSDIFSRQVYRSRVSQNHGENAACFLKIKFLKLNIILDKLESGSIQSIMGILRVYKRT